MGFRLLGAMTDLSIQPWSAVWRIPTSRGPVLLKQAMRTPSAEGKILAFCAAAAPEYVDPPLACDPSTGRILMIDGGSTMSQDLATPDAFAALVGDYAALQQATIGRRREAEAAGMLSWDPADAAQGAARQAAALHALPASDPRHITTAQRDQLLDNLDVYTVSGTALANSPIPYCLDHGDLWSDNVLTPRAVGGRYRFIDFGDAAWTHPFLSLLSLLVDGQRQWSPSWDMTHGGLDHPALEGVIDAYLQSWSGYASRPHLERLLGHALVVAPLRRSHVLLAHMTIATDADAEELGPTPWTWLTQPDKLELRCRIPRAVQ